MSDEQDFGFISGSDYINLHDDTETWLIEPLVPSGGWVNLYGIPKVARKSYLALGMSWAISTAQDKWLGFDLMTAGPVLYMQVDTPRNLWRERLEHIASAGYDFSNIYFADPYSAPSPFNIFIHGDTLRRMIDNLVDEIKMDPVMIVLDTGRKIHQGNENDNGEMSIMMDTVQDIAPKMGKELVTHQKKGADFKDHKTGVFEDGPLMDGNRGASAVTGAVDTIIRLTEGGRMDFQGRATAGEERKQLRFERVCQCDWPSKGRRCPGHWWVEDKDTVDMTAEKLVKEYPQGDASSLARMLCKQHDDVNFEAARKKISRLREKLAATVEGEQSAD